MNLKDFLLGIKDTKGTIYYRPNGGNAGDALINLGFYELANSINLNYTIFEARHLSGLSEADIVLVAGGGTIVPEWRSTTDFLNVLLTKRCRVVILPQSIRDADEVMKKTRKGDVVFLREKYSYDYCKSLGIDAEVYLDDDTALYVDVNKIKASRVKILTSRFYRLRNIIRIFLLLYHKIRSFFIKDISAIRVDSESANKNSNKIYNDLSLVAAFGSSTVDDDYFQAKVFLNLIDSYNNITTDRLHVLIAAFLLGKKVYVKNNSYYKILGVYQNSLSKMDSKRQIHWLE